jgi:hypothetical protein
MAEETRLIPPARVETRDIPPGFIWAAVATCAVLLLACALLVVWLYPQSILDQRIEGPLPVYPEPRLQPDPAADMRRFKAQQREHLNTAGWVDRAQGIVHIPIDQAMEQIARQGIPGWPAP